MLIQDSQTPETFLQQASPAMLRKLIEIQDQISSAGLDQKLVMNTIASSACDLTQASGAVVEMQDGDDVVYQAVSGQLAQPFLGLKIKIQGSLSGLAIRTNQLLVSNDSVNDPRVDAVACKRVGLRSMMVVPLSLNDRVVGVLKVMSDRVNAFTNSHEGALRFLAGSLARSLSHAEEATAKSQQFESLANALPQLAWIANSDGFIHWYNTRWYEFTGMSPEDVHTPARYSVYDQTQLPELRSFWQKAIADGDFFEMKFQLRAANGLYRVFLTRVMPVRDQNHKLVSWFGTNTDIDALERAKDEAEKASDLKSAFLANMSHEIRTPLGAMMGFADLLSDPNLSLSQRQGYSEILRRNGEQLNRVINDILDLSKVETGHVDFEYLKIQPLEIASEVIALMKIATDAKNIELRLVDDGTAPREIIADATRIKQILLNLISNALKFTNSGSIELRIRAGESSLKESECVFEVADTGVGISPASIARLFKVFSQADSSMTRKYGGTGLGLALSRSLARSMGGDVMLVETEVSRGSVFRLVVKSRDDFETANAQTHSSLAHDDAKSFSSEPLKGIKILLVDDSADNRQLIERYLRKFGASVEMATNGLKGVKEARKGDHDLVLMDLQMPIMDGYTAVETLRSQGFDKPIIALTAHAMSEVRKKCQAIGCTDHLPKPINAEHLVQTILRHTKA